jgi:sarcosine oxidase gamma subunit
VSRLAFLSVGDAAYVSPLRDARSHPRVADVSAIGKLELRGAVDDAAAEWDETLLPLGPRRALLVTPDAARAAARLDGSGVRSYDITAALAAVELEGEDLMRRVTDLDLAALPATGSILRGTQAVIERRGPDRFRLFVAQELGHFVADTLADLAEGLDA